MKRTHSVAALTIVTGLQIFLALFFFACGGDADSSAETQSDQAPQQTPAESNPLQNTEWRLVEFQSMDDAIGAVRPENPSVYTMRLAGDGTVSMQLNCNRANGSWSAMAGSDTSGSFQFGPLAMTRALCPPPSLDEQIARDAEYVRSYLLRDGRLYLSLMADAGIYTWEPLHAAAGRSESNVSYQAEPDAKIEASLLAASPDYRRSILGETPQLARYVYSRTDLNDDGKEEVFVYPMGSIFCGSGGCTLFLLTEEGDGYSLVDSFPITRLPVTVSQTRTNNWCDLIRLESGGGAQASYVLHVFNGRSYDEKERIPGDSRPEGTHYLSGEPTYADGAILQPPD